MDRTTQSSLWGLLPAWNGTWALAIVFGLASVPWTYAFVAGQIPLWPSFIASATFYAADADGVEGLKRAVASNLAGIGYAAVTLAVVEGILSGGVLTLSLVVGMFMFLASLHAFVPLLSFTPGGFFGYATMFSVHAAHAGVFGIQGLSGQTLATAMAMVIGALVGFGTDELSERLA